MKDHSEKIKELAEGNIYHYVFEHAGSALIIADVETGGIVECNAQAEILTGRTREQIIGMHQWDLHPKGEEEKYKKKFALHIEQEHITDFEGEIQHSDGKRIPVMISAQIVDVSGKKVIMGIFVDLSEPKHTEEESRKYLVHLEKMVESRTAEFEAISDKLQRDIAERMRMEEALRKGEERFRAIFESTRDCILVWDKGYNYLYANQAAIDHLGTTRDKIVGKNMRDALGHIPDFMQRWMKRVDEVFASGKPVHVRDKVMMGDRLVCSESTLSPIRDSAGTIFAVGVVYRDVTERVQAEEAVREREDFLSSIFTSIQDGISILDKNMDIIRVNPTMERWYAHAMPLVGKKCYEAYHSRTEPCEACPTRKTLTTGESAYEIVLLTGPGGETVGWLDLYSFPLLDRATGKLMGVIEYVRDISERKRAEEALRASEAKYRVVADNTYAWEFWMAPDGCLDYSSPSCERITGYTAKEFEADPALLLAIIHPDDRSRFASHEQDPDRGALPSELEFRIVYRDGSVRWISHVCQQIYGADGKYLGTRGSNRDISGHKLAEEALKESEERYRSFFEQAPDSVILFDAHTGDFAAFNDRAHKNLGYTRKEFQRLRIQDFELIESPEEVSAHIQKIVNEGGGVFETKQRTKSGEIRDILVSARPISAHGKTFIQAIWRDITGQKRAGEILRKSEEKYRALVETTNTGFLILDSAGRVVDANAEYVRLTGHRELREILGRTVIEWTAEYEKRKNAAAVAQCIKSGFIRNLNIDYVDRTGRITPIEINATVIGSGELLRIISLCRDITERKKVEEELRKSEEKYRALMDGAGEAILLADTEGHILEANKRALELLGYSKNALTTMHFAQLHPEQERERAAAAFKNIVENRGGEVSDLLLLRKDGKVVPMDVTGSIIEYPGKTVFQGIFRDISERKRIEQMKDNLIRDVSHELKAPIAVMEMAFDMGQQAIEAGDVNAIQNAWRIGSRNIKTLSRDVNNILEMFSLSAGRAVPQRKQISLKKMATEIVRDFQDPIAQKKLRVKIDIPGKIDKIYADVRMMRTLIYNIIDNAVKFTRRGAIALTVSSRGNEVWIKVKDTGCGIALKDTSIVFTKFFKQDPSIHGTGLGLAICKEIAEIYGGTIQVTSAGTGKGTAVTVKLPRAALGV